ncbi:MAG: 2-phospho-L-lactate transferase [Acidobacteria bacterium]|nr:2-phospho-L-lactate transferase [Acidobacteriota bacterium]
MIVTLAGGTGAAKLVLGLAHVVPSEKLAVIVNTGDDIELFGLRICPDLDTVAYTLSGRVNPQTGWGIHGDTFNCLTTLADYGAETWFRLGDRDLATHLWRSQLLRQGLSLSEVTQRICRALSVTPRLIPMTDAYTPTEVVTDDAVLHLQEYFVRERCRPVVRAFRYSNMGAAQPSPGIEELIMAAEAVVICPSNPFISIGPILAVPGIRHFLRQTAARVIAVSPIVAGRALKGPTANMLRQMGHPVSARAVADLYCDFLDVFVLDRQDFNLIEDIEALGMKAVAANTLMNTLEDKVELARQLLESV